uniref:Beta-lactamase domain-containing protein n=1 Tax=Ascaris lumbricoides TaxID=6252 RepID=A0A0M3I589_ASCLU
MVAIKYVRNPKSTAANSQPFATIVENACRMQKLGDRDEIELDENNNENNNQKITSEFLNNKSYRNVEEALEIFKNDALISKPGSEFHYTTHGYTLLSAVLEKVATAPFQAQARQLFRELGMNHSLLDDNRQITANRTRYYYRDRHHKLKNAPEVDNSYKWAGGGLLSTVDDLLIFANSMLYSFHYSRCENPDPVNKPEPLMKPEVLKIFWQGEIDGTHGFRYGLGWYKSEIKSIYGGGNGWTRNGFWLHTGAAVGASSILFVKPNFEGTDLDGICIAILVNLHNCGELINLALEIAEIFEHRHHKLKNAPEVDNSYKWAGGGLLSTVDDLLIFANSMLYRYAIYSIKYFCYAKIPKFFGRLPNLSSSKMFDN